MLNLFSDTSPWREPLTPSTVMLQRFVRERVPAPLQTTADVAHQLPSHQMTAPGGYTMSIIMTNCGTLSRITDRHSCLCSPVGPLTNQTWPLMPAVFRELALTAAVVGDYPNFSPDACLINRYQSGAKLSLHQDKDEQDLWTPIASVSLDLSAIFQFGELQRSGPLQRLLPEHGDVVVWGGESRLFYRGIQPLKTGHHLKTNGRRYNLTFRQTGSCWY